MALSKKEGDGLKRQAQAETGGKRRDSSQGRGGDSRTGSNSAPTPGMYSAVTCEQWRNKGPIFRGALGVHHFLSGGMSILEHFVSCTLKWGPIFSWHVPLPPRPRLGGGGGGMFPPVTPPNSYIAACEIKSSFCFMKCSHFILSIMYQFNVRYTN